MTPLAQSDDTLLHAGREKAKGLASAIAGCLRHHGYAQVDAVGPHCVSNAVKAIAIARAYLKPSGFDLHCVPAFRVIPNRDRPGNELTQMVFDVRRVDG